MDRFGLSRSTKRVTIAITSGKICDGSGEGFGPPREEGSLFPRKDRKGTREGVQLRGAKSADEMGLVDPTDFDPEAELSLTQSKVGVFNAIVNKAVVATLAVMNLMMMMMGGGNLCALLPTRP